MNAARPATEWTVLLYMAANSGLDGPARKLIALLAQHRYGPDVNVLVEVNSEEGPAFRARLDGRVETYATWPKLDMSRGETLTEFIDWGTSKFPSRHTALIMWSHGGGWEDRKIDPKARRRPIVPPSLDRRIKRDSIAWDGDDYMTDQELRSAIAKSEAGRVDLFGCDACQMGALEIAYEMRSLCDYFVGSEENENGNWEYETVLRALVERPRTSPRELAASFVTSYAPERQGYTICAVESSLLDALGESVSVLAKALVDYLHPQSAAKHSSKAYEKLREAALEATLPSLPTVVDVDLRRFLGALDARDIAGVATEGVAKALDSARYQVTVAPNVSQLGGLSIFFPVASGLTDWGLSYGTLDFGRTNRWSGFLRAYFDADRIERSARPRPPRGAKSTSKPSTSMPPKDGRPRRRNGGGPRQIQP